MINDPSRTKIVRPDQGRVDQVNNLTFEPVAGPIVLLIAAVFLFGLLIFRPKFGELSKSRRSILTGLRTLAILMTLLALVRPGCVMQIEKSQTGVVEIFVDQTRSMQLPHRTTGPSRFETMQAMIENNRDRIEKLEQNNIRCRWFAFDNQLVEINQRGQQISFPETADGEETDIGSSIYAGVQLVRNQRLLATVLASDGVQNAIDPKFDLNEAVRLVNGAQIPLFCVPFGLADESSQLADLSIENLSDQFAVRVENSLQVSVTLSAKGFAGQQIPVQLIQIDPDGGEQILDTRRVSITDGIERKVVTLNHTPLNPGQFQILVRATPQPSESATANNELPSFLTVEDRGVNVLLLYGSLDHEAQMLRRSLRGDSVVSVDAFPLDKRSASNWPLDISSYLANTKYDVILFSNIDSRAIYRETFQEKNLEVLEDRISSGKGFAMLGGYNSFGPGMYHSTPLAQLLPVAMENFEMQELDEPPKLDFHLGGNVAARPTRSHYITRLGTDSNGNDIWETLPELKTPNRLQVKESARILLETESGDPLMATTTVGGRVLAFAGADTWKWRAYSAEAHKRFWRQMILWLAGQDGLTGDDVWVYMPQRRFQLGQDATFSTGITAANTDSIDDPNFTATLVAPDGNRTEIDVQAQQSDFGGAIERELLKQVGLYSIEVIGRSGTREMGETDTQFVVFDNDLEKSVTGADLEQMARLAYQTKEWGGKVVQPDEFGELLDDILELAPDNKIEIPKRWRLGDSWQDGLAFVFLFVGILTTEWFFRKKWGLV